ncbi:unnamed protein product [Calypogeia fissa]
MASRAVVTTEPEGDPQKDWKVVTRDKPKASPGHVVVKIILRPVNPTDTLTPKYFLSHLKGKEVVIGSDGVGFVEEVGEGVTKVKVGQRVVPSFINQFFVYGNGSWQDYVEVKEEELFTIPESISDEIAAQFLINPWTVYGLVSDQAVPKGEYLLQNAAGSVIGRLVIQLAKHWGIKTINVVRREEQIEELKSLGADEVINSRKEDVIERVKGITGGKLAYGALDPVAGIGAKTIAKCVRNGGKVFIYGNMGTEDNDATIDIFDLGRVDIKWWGLNDFLKGPEQMQEVAAAVTKLLQDKVIVPPTGKVFKFEDFKGALLEADKPGRGGKVLLAS